MIRFDVYIFFQVKASLFQMGVIEKTWVVGKTRAQTELSATEYDLKVLIKKKSLIFAKRMPSRTDTITLPCRTKKSASRL